MRIAITRALILAAMLAVSCGQAVPAAQKSATPTAAQPSEEPRKSDIRGGDPSWFQAEITLEDGRGVAMHYRKGKGLYEQHRGPQGWSKPHLIYATKAEACQGIELKAGGGTVTAIADFGKYCADGEPPMESIAAVGVGDLSSWDHHLTRSFDGWERAKITEGGRKVTFERGATRLVWTSTSGF